MQTPTDLVRVLYDYRARLEEGGEISGAELAHILMLLTRHEREEGGPYVLTPGRSDVDTGLNILIARVLKLLDVELPKLESYLKNAPRVSEILTSEELAAEFAWREKANDPHTELPESLSDEEVRCMQAVRMAVEKRLTAVDESLAARVRFVLERTIAGNPDGQMSRMALYMRQALGDDGTNYSDAHIGELGCANACFWASFIVYDDFWDDDEAAEPSLLPAANLMAREYSRYFTELLPKESGFSDFFHALMDKVDAANTWETLTCRIRVVGDDVHLPNELPAYKDFGVKFYPAAGHIFGPLALLVQEGYAVDSLEAQSLINYFTHYLVAMQLNDDAHDWKEDLGRGHISTAVAILLLEWERRYPDRRTLNLESDMAELEQIFWFSVLDRVCDFVFERCRQATEALEALNFLKDPAPLKRFIERNEAVALQARRERVRSEEFLAAYEIMHTT